MKSAIASRIAKAEIEIHRLFPPSSGDVEGLDETVVIGWLGGFSV